ncbi:prepilin-type N-terminal cleavage/methylation domain-containing protein [Pectobacterium brasiliense]|uniref:Prepilin-type N-terminal cleavage/methylation domain-containing protein n=1 Tax=Pectobacterium brasiliense TaxID=180957 RepID=A0AAE3BEB5_9GAMM|nr:type 4 pilus major pilin [Pectobacterium brasiliense]MBN3051398.1 prepilin-type N-terminal cleavage/methylation domain-containing protein [Pectobacterium brasiliense]
MVLLKNRKYRKGFSLLELILVLGVIAGLIVSAFMIYPKAQAAQRAEIEVKNITAIVSGINAIYGSSPNYTGINARTLIDAKIIPSQMRVEGSYQVVNIWKGPVNFSYGMSNFSITYGNVPSVECAKIVLATASMFSSISVGDNEGYDEEGNEVGTSGTVNQGAKNIDEITKYCSNESNVITFGY